MESYTFSVQSVVRGVEGKLGQEDVQKVEEVKGVLEWVERSQLAEKEYELKLTELQKLCSPIMTKLHMAGGPSGNTSSQEPTVWEVDQTKLTLGIYIYGFV